MAEKTEILNTKIVSLQKEVESLRKQIETFKNETNAKAEKMTSDLQNLILFSTLFGDDIPEDVKAELKKEFLEYMKVAKTKKELSEYMTRNFHSILKSMQ